MQLIDGKAAASQWIEETQARVNMRLSQGKPAPHLAAIIVGTDGASQTYVNNKIKACKNAGIDSTLITLPADIQEHELLHHIDDLNANPRISGFIVQLPLPKHINERTIITRIKPEKDVDGFHPQNIGKMVLQHPTLISATPLGILRLLNHYNIETSGKHCVILGRSAIVGKPLSILLSQNSKPGNCTVTLCHSKTPDLKSYTLSADILICAIGIPEYISSDMVQAKTVVIDVGTTRVTDLKQQKGYRLCGDVNFNSVAPHCQAITPVPGGVGPMTIAALLHNTLEASEQQV